MAGKIGTLIVKNLPGSQEPTEPPRPEPAPLPVNDPRVHITRDALAYFEHPETCIYLGRRYGLTPHGPAGDLLDGVVSGVEPPRIDLLAKAMNWLAGQMGTVAAQRHLSERYSQLDLVDDGVDKELADLAPLVASHVLATGSYSARIQNALGPALSVVHGDKQIDGRLTPGRSRRAHLLMLHGSEHDFQNAMVTEDDVLTYREHRPTMAAALTDLLEYPWVVMGADKAADSTFYLLMRNVCHRLGMPQRPIFVIDPRPEAEVATEWPSAALRHVGLTPAQFLSLARTSDDA